MTNGVDPANRSWEINGYRGGMNRIAIAGGIGSGKSTVLGHLADLGYPTIDADDISRELSQPGQVLHRALVDAFGAGVLLDGQIDRAFLAHLVFSSPDNLARLNAITHPPIIRAMRERMDRCTARAVFVALPLFRDHHRDALSLDEAWGILASPDVALERLITGRGMSLGDAQARIATQGSNGERAALCDVVVWNDHGPSELLSAIDTLLTERGL